MTQNPYADYGQTDEVFGEEPSGGRTSILAIVALVCSITCILSPFGLILGGLAIVLIAFSGGRTRGTGIAIAALVIGLVASVLSIGLTVGLNAAFVQMMVKPANDAITAVMNDDPSAVRDQLDQSVQANATDEVIASFASAIRAEHGELVETTESSLAVIGMFTSMEAALEAAQQSSAEFPSAARFTNGTVLISRRIDPNSPPQGGGLAAPPAINIGVYGADGSAIWLFEDAASIQSAPAPVLTPAPDATPAPETTPTPDTTIVSPSSNGRQLERELPAGAPSLEPGTPEDDGGR